MGDFEQLGLGTSTEIPHVSSIVSVSLAIRVGDVGKAWVSPQGVYEMGESVVGVLPGRMYFGHDHLGLDGAYELRTARERLRLMYIYWFTADAIPPAKLTGTHVYFVGLMGRYGDGKSRTNDADKQEKIKWSALKST